MSMTEREATREMTFDEEYEILQAEANELFAKEDERSEPPFANCVVRRALRCIRKLREEREKYRAIGTVSEFQQLKEKATAKKPYYVKYDYNGNPEQVVYNCPNCKGFVLYQHGACSCGQKLDWSEGKE